MPTNYYPRANELYAGNMPSVNALPLPFSLRLAASCAGVSLKDIAGVVYQAICESLKKEIPRSVMVVLAAYLEHANDGHNRVFASVDCIHDDIAKKREKAMAKSTVEEAKSLLVALGILRPLWGDELMAGDGPHRAGWRGHKRKGRFPVNTYEFGGIWRYLTEFFRSLFARAIRPRNNIKASGSQLSLARVSSARLSSTSPQNDSNYFAPHSATDTQSAFGSAIDPLISSKGKIPSNSVYDVDMPIDIADRGQAEGQTQEASGKLTPLALRRKVPNTKNRGSYSGSPLLARLRSLGLRGPVPGRIVESMSAAWVEKFVRFSLWRQRSGLCADNEPGYLVRTWENHRDEPILHGWEEAFERSERLASAAQVTTLPAHALKSSAPVVRPSVPKSSEGGGRKLWEGLRKKMSLKKGGD